MNKHHNLSILDCEHHRKTNLHSCSMKLPSYGSRFLKAALANFRHPTSDGHNKAYGLASWFALLWALNFSPLSDNWSCHSFVMEDCGLSAELERYVLTCYVH